MENKKTKTKKHYLFNKEKLQKRSREYYGVLTMLEKKHIILTLEIKICPMQIKKEKKKSHKIISINKAFFLNHLINPVNKLELENVYLKKVKCLKRF